MKDANRFWREEREEGAIYDTYLKKVTYRTISEVPSSNSLCNVISIKFLPIFHFICKDFKNRKFKDIQATAYKTQIK